MRTSKIKALMAFVLGFIMLNFTTAKVEPAPKTEKATCPYYIGNNLACPITVDITIYKPSMSGCTGICVVYTGVPVGPGALYQMNCAGCNICNIEVTVTDIGGTPPTTSSVADFSSTSGVPLSGGGCPSSGIAYAPGALPGGNVFKVF